MTIEKRLVEEVIMHVHDARWILFLPCRCPVVALSLPGIALHLPLPLHLPVPLPSLCRWLVISLLVDMEEELPIEVQP